MRGRGEQRRTKEIQMNANAINPNTLTTEQVFALPTHFMTGNAMCPKCKHYNALVTHYAAGTYIFVCRDCDAVYRAAKWDK
jgi:transposase-like protein